MALLTDTLQRAAEYDNGSGLVDLDGSLQPWGQVAQAARGAASILIASGVEPGDRVAILQPKSAASFIALHGALLAGAIVVPLDPVGAPATVAGVIEQCDPAVVIGSATTIARLALDPLQKIDCPLVIVDETTPLTEAGLPDRRIIEWNHPLTGSRAAGSSQSFPSLRPDDPAYLIFTSGSTGVPKGIVHTHQSGLAYAITAAQRHRLTPTSRVAGIPPLHFDMSTLELYSTPLAGATAVSVGEPEQRFPASLSQRLENEQVTHLYAVPFLLRQLQERGALSERDLTAIEHIGYAGEPYAPGALADLMNALPHARVTNFYGPAETNVVTSYDLPGPPTDDEEIPIGSLWPDCTYKLVDDELYVSAPTCMSGYWREPELTAKKLEPQQDRPPWYGTGDLVDLDDDGRFTYRGRRDNQVKIRGVRLELEAIELLLTDAPGVEHAVVGPITGADGQPSLAAAVVLDPSESLNEQKMRRWCAGRVPAAAVPSSFIQFSGFPSTSSGKIDRVEVRAQIKSAPHPETPVETKPH